MADDAFEESAFGAASAGAELAGVVDGLQTRTSGLALSAGGFARAMSQAFAQSTVGGKQLDDVLKNLALRLSSLAVTQSLRPLASGLSGGISQILGGLVAGGSRADGAAVNLGAAMGAIKPFAAGGVIGTPTYFPLAGGGVGLAGEAGPEAILPLTRGTDGRLGVAASGRAGANVTIHIATPDVAGFRRSETYLAGQIARAVARGQRSL
jgi:phage-related minor tail protein